MSDLQNQTPANTYKGLLQVDDYTNGVNSTAKFVSDGEGTPSALSISESKVGVGTTSPISKFTAQIADNTAYANQTPDAVDSVVAVVNNPTAEAVNNHSSLHFNLNAGTHNHVASISLVSESASLRRGALAFCTDNGTTRPEAMRIDSNGNVGISTESPDAKLEVQSDANYIPYRGYRATTETNAHLIDLYSDVGGTKQLKFKIEADGNVIADGRFGIGTTSPDRLMHLASNAAIICIEDTAGATDDKRAQIQVDNGLFEIQSRNDDNSSRTANIFVADLGTGNIGMGTNSPSAPLEVASTTGGVIMPRMTTTQRDAISSPTDGEMIYNTTTNKFQGRANGAWVDFH